MHTAQAINATLIFLTAAVLAAGCGPQEAHDEKAGERASSTSAAANADNAGMIETGQAYLATNGARDGVTTTASGLQYKVLVAGEGPTPGPSDLATVHYTGTLTDGTVFDSSVARGEPAEFPVNRLIQGWTEALQLMQVGDKWMLYIPPELAYGDRGAGNLIGPGETLVFEIELLGVRSE